MSSSPDLQSPPGVVELREDVPLKAGAAGGGARLCGGGPRLILAAFAALTLAVTVALLTQIYAGDYEVVPHGSVSSSAAACAGAGAAALRRGGRAADASVATALCLAVLTPHRTSLDASGSLIYWEYRLSRSQLPTVLEWGAGVEAANASRERPPRLLVALAALHQRYGTRPWAELLQPAIDLARAGYPVSATLAAAAAAAGLAGYATPTRSDPGLADYLDALRHNTSSELCLSWHCPAAVRWAEGVPAARAGAWRVWGAGAGGALAVLALQSALDAASVDNSTSTVDSVLQSVVSSLQQQSVARAAQWPGGVASGVAVVDPRDTYVALVTGLSTPFGSEAGAGAASASAGAWARDAPAAPLDLAPAIIADQHVCGARYVVGAEAGAALAQGAAAMLLATPGGAVAAAERARLLLRPPARLLPEPAPPAPPGAPALNFVLQRGDALLSHADSRGGGVASRF
ncbi:glutathione hydrolase 6-like [Maniola jurtina]|uniref:glutathione hydrolase 6-like n=1 Tax=Maniola jurtina TaxID=191418 RepID=UPI001E687EAB|nr:glutathione hydrolase 6-like [Maniola jurtina]